MRSTEYLGSSTLVQGELSDGTPIEALLSVQPAPGETLWLQADAGVVHAFDKAGARVNMKLEQIAA